MSPVLPVSPNSLYVKHIQSAIMACNDGAGLHIRDADRLKTAIYRALDEALQTPIRPKPEDVYQQWELIDNDDALWRITITCADSGTSTGHYLVAANNCLGLQEILDIYQADAAFLARAIGHPRFIDHDMLLTGAVNLGLIHAVR
jgi:hypothetical protein